MITGRNVKMTIALTGLAAALVLVAVCGRGGAQDAPVPTDPDRSGGASADPAAKPQDELQEAATAYDIRLATDRPRRLTLHSTPLLRWSNPVRQGGRGAVFLWLDDGRPEAVGALYRFKRGEMLCEDHEFQSLAPTGLTATYDGRDVWYPKRPGLTLVPIPGAPAPGSTPAERLRQLRTLASQFKAFLDSPTQATELRLLARPLYRYETDRADGALFGFVQATDPEVLLLIESSARDGGTAWRYGLARLSMLALRAELKDRVVWRVDRDEDRFAPDKPYATYRARLLPIDDRPAADNP